ncbi:adenylate/guanylate cyclase domain-containing protein [Tumidithrix elongata RA019]|uniref:Adenylate/guanylate cyclase domain-containing protein n=1 Tax=Tumidithrix elongata BACA0141 TaxID=2716417 RepID=A0AAW9Q8M7_9CYAN|nr:adenylate/guanylate cyclase domain-containing protein [Tumidithrix elongata RA019]
MPTIQCLPDDTQAPIKDKQSILHALLTAEVPITHACGGNALCSTCRIMVLDGVQRCSPATSAERALAKRLDFPVHIRLACQTRVTGDVTVRRLVIDNADIDIVESQLSSGSTSDRKQVALLFASIQSITNFDELNFHYDVVYIMNRFFYLVNKTMNAYGGSVNSFVGSTFMAVFGIDSDDRVAERAAWAGLALLDAVNELNEHLNQLSYQPLRLSLGIHCDRAILISANPAQPQTKTVIGNVVDVVSRIALANRKLETQLLISQEAYTQLKACAIVDRSFKLAFPNAEPSKVYELIGITGDAPPAIAKSEIEAPFSNKLLSFVKKFATSWGK